MGRMPGDPDPGGSAASGTHGRRTSHCDLYGNAENVRLYRGRGAGTGGPAGCTAGDSLHDKRAGFGPVCGSDCPRTAEVSLRDSDRRRSLCFLAGQ